MWLNILKIIARAFLLLLAYAAIISIFKPHNQPQDSTNLLLQGDSDGLLNNYLPYLSFIKKYIASNFKEIQAITNIIFNALESIVPQTWLTSILSIAYFIITFAVGGGFSYFNRNIKQLSMHKAKIERGCDLQQAFEKRSKKLMKSKGKQMSLDEYRQHFTNFNELSSFLQKGVRKIKIIESTRRPDISKLLLRYLQNHQSSKLRYCYLNLSILPFNHDSSTKNLHLNILDDIIYGNLYEQDRGITLVVLKTVVKCCKSLMESLVNFVTTQWMTSIHYFLLGLSFVCYLIYTPLSAIIILYILISYLIKYRQLPPEPSSKHDDVGMSSKILVLDQFHLLKRELTTKRQVFNQQNVNKFQQVMNNMIHLAQIKNVQIILIIQDPLFYSDFISKVCSFDQLKSLSSFQIQQPSIRDALYLATYFNTSQDWLQIMLLWENDVESIDRMLHNKSQKLIGLDSTLKEALKNMQQIICSHPQLKDEIQTILRIITKLNSGLDVGCKLDRNQQKDLTEILAHFKLFLKSPSIDFGNDQVEQHLKDIRSIMLSNPLKNDGMHGLRQAYMLHKQKQTNFQTASKMFEQIYRLLNKRQVLYHEYFYSKSTCLAVYLWLLRKV